MTVKIYRENPRPVPHKGKTHEMPQQSGSRYTTVAELNQPIPDGPRALTFLLPEKKLKRLWFDTLITGRIETKVDRVVGTPEIYAAPDIRVKDAPLLEIQSWLAERGYFLDLSGEFDPETLQARWTDRLGTPDVEDLQYSFARTTAEEREEILLDFPQAEFHDNAD